LDSAQKSNLAMVNRLNVLKEIKIKVLMELIRKPT
jgi:hypothetical protein